MLSEGYDGKKILVSVIVVAWIQESEYSQCSSVPTVAPGRLASVDTEHKLTNIRVYRQQSFCSKDISTMLSVMFYPQDSYVLIRCITQLY
jgi:hypothetical protein